MKNSSVRYYNPDAHMEDDGSYVYKRFDPVTGNYLTEKITREKDGTITCIRHDSDPNSTIIVTKHKDIPENALKVLDDWDREWATKEEAYRDHTVAIEIKMQDSEDVVNILDTLASAAGNPEAEIICDKATERVIDSVIREAISTLSPKMQELFYAHYGELRFLEDIKDEEIAASGKNITKQAISKRKQTLIKYVAQYLRDKGYGDYKA